MTDTNEAFGDYFRGAGVLAKRGIQALGKTGEQDRKIEQYKHDIENYTRQLASKAEDRLRATPIAQRLVHSVLQLNKLGIDGYSLLTNEVMSMAKQASVPEMRDRLKDAMRYLGINSLAPQQKAPVQQQPAAPVVQQPNVPPVQKQAPAPVQKSNKFAPGGVAPAFQSGGKAKMVGGQHGPMYKFEDNYLDLSNVELVDFVMPMLYEMEFLEEGKKKKKGIKKMARRVYHRDYERTKNKPYRKYDPKRREHASLTESLSDFLEHNSESDARSKLYHDLHLLRLIASQTRPRSTEVANESGKPVVRFFYAATEKKSDIFEEYQHVFGEPKLRVHKDDLIEAHFKDPATSTNVKLSYIPSKNIFYGSYPLNSNTAMGGLNEYFVQQISTVAGMLSEGKIHHRDIFLMLIETPGIGQPYGGGTNPDPYGQADLRRDVSGMTDQIVWLRQAVSQQLKSDDHDWTYFSNAPTVEEATNRLVGIISKMTEAKGANRAAIQQAAEQIARVYWGHGM